MRFKVGDTVIAKHLSHIRNKIRITAVGNKTYLGVSIDDPNFGEHTWNEDELMPRPFPLEIGEYYLFTPEWGKAPYLSGRHKVSELSKDNPGYFKISDSDFWWELTDFSDIKHLPGKNLVEKNNEAH